MQTSNLHINKQLLAAIEDPSSNLIKQYIRKIVLQARLQQQQSFPLLKQTMASLSNILKDPNIHPKTKFQSHRIIIYLLLLADLDVYEEFIQSLYGILKANCLYNKSLPLQTRGEDFFKKSKYFTDPSATIAQKNQIKKCGALYIIFCLQTIQQLAKWLPYDLVEDTKPTKFSITYDNLIKEGVEFPREENLQFYQQSAIDEVQNAIKQMQKQFESIISGSENKVSSIGELKVISNDYYSQLRKVKGSTINKSPSVLHNQMNTADMENKNKIFLLEDEKAKLLKQIEIQRRFFEGELQKQRKVHQDNIFKYEKKITNLQEQIQKMREKLSSIQSKAVMRQSQRDSRTNLQGLGGAGNSLMDRGKDKIIEDLQIMNKQLNSKVKSLQQILKSNENQKQSIKNSGASQSASVMSVQIEKLKKQNRSLKTKLLTECSQASQFSTKKSNSNAQGSQKQPQSLKFLGYEDARSSFEPFYSNSSSQIKIRLRKAILREKQLLYRDKILQIGCITKQDSINAVRLIIVFTNISQKPLFNFGIDFVSREDLVVKLIQNTKNYLQISGQTKAQILVSVNQIDFRCLLCAVRFNLQNQAQKLALIMPISKLKLAQQLVFTPIKKNEKLKKIEKVFQYDKKIIPNLHKFKQYFDQAILDVDRTQHETYHLKMQFMGSKFYVQCDDIEGQLRIAVKYYEEEQFSRAQKLLQELVFLFMKG